MSSPHQEGDPISFYPSMNVKWLRNEIHRAKLSAATARLFRMRTDNEQEFDKFTRRIARERENVRRCQCDLEKRFATQVEEEGEATQAGLYQA